MSIDPVLRSLALESLPGFAHPGLVNITYKVSKYVNFISHVQNINKNGTTSLPLNITIELVCNLKLEG